MPSRRPIFRSLTSRPFKSVLPLTELRTEFAGRLRSMTVVEAAIWVANEPSGKKPSGHAVEKALGWLKPRPRCRGNRESPHQSNSGRAARARRGALKHRPATLEHVIDVFPGVMPVLSPLLWALMDGENEPSLDLLNALDDAAFWGIHTAFLGHPGRINVLSEDCARGLVICGTFDALATLWWSVNKAVKEGRHSDSLRIAQYLPPAAAALSCRPEAARIAPLLFARCRQQVLDAVSANGKRLDLFNYDYSRAAADITDWSTGLPAGMKIDPYEGLAGIAGLHAQEWLNRWKAPLTGSDARTGIRWANNCLPSNKLASMNLHSKALKMIRSTLGDYF